MSTPPYLRDLDLEDGAAAGGPTPRARGFFLSRRDLVIVTVGLAALGLLLFAAGLLLGLYAIGPLPARQATRPAAQASDPPQPAAAAALAPEPEPEPEEELPVVTSAEVAVDEEAEPPPEPARVEPSPPAEVAVAKPSPKPAPPKVTLPKPTAKARAFETIYEVQLGYFRSRDNAESFRRELRERGWEPYLVDTKSAAGTASFTVRLGPFAGPAEAEAEAARFEGREGQDTMIRFRDVPAAPSEAG